MTLDTLLGLLGTVLGLIGLVTGYIFYRRSLRIKEPDYYIISNRLIQNSVSNISDLEILHRGQKIKTLSVSKILFWNRGYDTSEKSHIVIASPLRIESSEGNRILDVTVVEMNDSSSQFSVEIEENRACARLSFDYLDKDQGAILQVIHTGTTSNDIRVEGRLKGATIRRYVPRRTFVRKLLVTISFLVLIESGLLLTASLAGWWQLVIICIIILVWFPMLSRIDDWLWAKLSGPFGTFYEGYEQSSDD